ncbi:MAG: LysM peptidoglycan-binding domain-containing protein [Ignavibacteria bacterium]|nr:LysM peptidoglycan-binding domain-containing protein [Ignavibacteria bacterium]
MTMKILNRLTLVAALVLFICASAAAQEMTKEEWQKQMTEFTAKRNDLRNKLTALQAEVDRLKKEDADKAAALKKCNDDIMALVGATPEAERAFAAKLDQIDAKINELSRLSNQDLWARKGEVDDVQKMLDEVEQNKMSALPKYYNRIKEQQNRIDALKKSLEAAQIAMTYTVGTWAKDRDCLWNIAKKPKIYDNAFLWPKIWQNNREQIKNPDIIKPGQKLKIPPKADLTKEEKAAHRSYWQRKQAAAVQQ